MNIYLNNYYNYGDINKNLTYCMVNNSNAAIDYRGY